MSPGIVFETESLDMIGEMVRRQSTDSICKKACRSCPQIEKPRGEIPNLRLFRPSYIK